MNADRLSTAAHALWAMVLSLPLAACPQDMPLAHHPMQDVPCALDGAADFAQTCTLEDMGEAWLLSRPDGGIVRLKRVKGGAITADGFPRVAARRMGGKLVLATGHDRYRLPW